MKVGDSVETKSSGRITIIEIISRDRILIEFEDGIRKEIPRKGLYDGKVKNVYQPSVLGIGIVGEGYLATTKEYKVWYSMLNRCYGVSYTQESYIGCTTVGEWYKLQNFAEWCSMAKGFTEKGWELDKDLLVPNNRVYAPDTCVFLPKAINGAIKGYANADESVGVNYSHHTKHYNVICFDNDKGRPFGRSFLKESDAKDFYKINRFNRLKVELEKYEDILDDRAVNRILEVIKI